MFHKCLYTVYRDFIFPRPSPINQVNVEFNAIEYIRYEYRLFLHSETNYVKLCGV